MSDKPRFTDIVKVAAHDMNNHLAILVGYFDLELLDKKNVSDAVEEGLLIARQAASDLTSLVSNFANIVEMREKSLEPSRQETDISALVLGIMKKEMLPVAAEAGVELIRTGELKAIYCAIDKHLISHAVINLVKNAIKCTPKGGRVELSVAQGADGIEIAVKDAGPPIPPEYREKIFDMSSIKEVGQARLKRQIGIGLVFCKLASQAHGGSIRVEPEGKKNVFILTLPEK